MFHNRLVDLISKRNITNNVYSPDRLHLIEVFHPDRMIHVIIVCCNQHIENNKNDIDVV
jgi:hypothetical protein